MRMKKIIRHTVKLQWLEHLWDHGNLFERWVVRANEFLSWQQVRKQMAIIYGNVFDLQQNNGDEAILMSTIQHTISSENKKISLNICVLELSEKILQGLKNEFE